MKQEAKKEEKMIKTRLCIGRCMAEETGKKYAVCEECSESDKCKQAH